MDDALTPPPAARETPRPPTRRLGLACLGAFALLVGTCLLSAAWTRGRLSDPERATSVFQALTGALPPGYSGVFCVDLPLTERVAVVTAGGDPRAGFVVVAVEAPAGGEPAAMRADFKRWMAGGFPYLRLRAETSVPERVRLGGREVEAERVRGQIPGGGQGEVLLVAVAGEGSERRGLLLALGGTAGAWDPVAAEAVLEGTAR